MFIISPFYQPLQVPAVRMCKVVSANVAPDFKFLKTTRKKVSLPKSTM